MERYQSQTLRKKVSCKEQSGIASKTHCNYNGNVSNNTMQENRF